jgi:hypothetical protein
LTAGHVALCCSIGQLLLRGCRTAKTTSAIATSASNFAAVRRHNCFSFFTLLSGHGYSTSWGQNWHLDTIPSSAAMQAGVKFHDTQA